MSRGQRKCGIDALPLLCALSLAACSAAEPGSLRASIVIDKAVLTYVEVFQAFALSATTTDAQRVTCDDIPSNYRIGDQRLDVADQVQISWDKQPVAGEIKLEVPAEEKLLIVVRGLANSPGGAHTVARGCADNLSFADGSSNAVTIDVLATTGAPCFAQSDCEVRQTCHTAPAFPGGYCAKLLCNADLDCLPGSRCILDQSGGICARPCESLNDCKNMSPGGYACVGRTGPGGCAMVCVGPTWNTEHECE